MFKKAPVFVAIVIVTILVALVGPSIAQAWDVKVSASADCKGVYGQFKNTEGEPPWYRPDNWNDMNVRMETPFGATGTQLVKHGTTANFSVPAAGDKPASYVKFIMSWANPQRSGTDQVNKDYGKVQNCTPPVKVTLCHATSSQTNPYTQNTVSINSVGDAQTVRGHGDHDGDIIPPFTYGDFNYPGKNWDANGQAIWKNGCEVPDVVTIEIQQYNNCDQWERSARLLVNGEGASSFVVVDHGTWPLYGAGSLPALNTTVTITDGPAEYNGTYKVSFPAMAAPTDCGEPPTGEIGLEVTCEYVDRFVRINGGKPQYFGERYFWKPGDTSVTLPEMKVDLGDGVTKILAPAVTVQLPDQCKQKWQPEADVCQATVYVPSGTKYGLNGGPMNNTYTALDPTKLPVFVFGVGQLNKNGGDTVNTTAGNFTTQKGDNPRIFLCVPVAPPANLCPNGTKGQIFAVRGISQVNVSGLCDPDLVVKVNGVVVYQNSHFGNERIRIPDVPLSATVDIYVDGQLFQHYDAGSRTPSKQ